ncbi:SCP-2 sterol transfer family protein [Tepidimonas fonticaldi]|uniref:Ubiquinone biosynthesis accessory factor UbiT n=1 Tax=Tepidimonas fonticaldi TaxID=1101373 RepID=A0A554XM34_9BURK|nr:SCP2 sterol-binding domain-containing protein [Tepidimonas fonticaldi]TSE36866.1 SCP-2 sterol transfer family protein [Tepidimonas fonticaldi]
MPAPLRALVRRLPGLPGSVALALALNAALRPRIPSEVLTTLCGRRIRLLVQDIDVRFDVTVHDGLFRPCTGNGAADLTIGAKAIDFIRLARREIDADTLFFNRRLHMEGDTELGLLLKNTLDTVELPSFWQALPPPAQWPSLVRHTLPPLSCADHRHEHS